MKNFNRGAGFNDRKGGGGFGQRNSGGRNFKRGAENSDRPEMHKAICTNCGQSCEVPFKPTGDRPVLCSNCFKGKDGQSSSRPAGRDFNQTKFSDKPMFKATCAECGAPCEVPFKPSGDRPILCSNCFGKNDSRGKNNNSHNQSHNNSSPSFEQFEILNAKLDKILRALNPVSSTEPSTKKEIIKEIKIVDAKNTTKKSGKKTAAPKTVISKKAKKK